MMTDGYLLGVTFSKSLSQCMLRVGSGHTENVEDVFAVINLVFAVIFFCTMRRIEYWPVSGFTCRFKLSY